MFHSLTQRHHFHTYLAGLLAPHHRAKTLTALAEDKSLAQTQVALVQQLQFFLSESCWGADLITIRTLQLLVDDPLTASDAYGILVIDDNGDRKDGYATDRVARQYLGSVGKVKKGIVAATTLWANKQRYYLLNLLVHPRKADLQLARNNPASRSKPQSTLALVICALATGIAFKAIVADCFYGDHREFVATLRQRQLLLVLSHRGTVRCGWAPADVAHSFEEAIEELPPCDWYKVMSHFRDGHVEQWWAAEFSFLGYSLGQSVCAICATTDRSTLPEPSAWYLTINLALAAAPLEEVVHLVSLRPWVEQGYKEMKDQLGWFDFMVRSDLAISRR